MNKIETEETETVPTVRFEPLNDMVQLKMDLKEESVLERGIKDRPTVLPSGTVVAVGRGPFLPGVGWAGPQVAVGDHVAVSTDGAWIPLPLSTDKREVHIAVSESLILGKLFGADRNSAWFKASEDAPQRIASIVSGGGRR